MPADSGPADRNGSESPAPAAGTESAAMPHIRLGPHTLSRLICGANPFNAGSHLSAFVNHAMREYYTPEQVLKTLRRCQQVGINCWQSGMVNIDLYRRFLDEGGRMHYISLTGPDPECVRTLKDAGCLAVACHGEGVDRLFRAGRLEETGDELKRIHDVGLLAGVSTHMPDVVDAVESAGWDVDFYMTCVYERHRPAEQLKQLLGHVPLRPGEVYLSDDPPRMFKVMRQTARPCLAFKILAAGRLSDRPEWVERAFRDTLEAIKPTDGVIVGIYDRYSDQPAECADFVRRFSQPQ